MLRVCTRCNQENDHDGGYCQFCGNGILLSAIDNDDSIICWVQTPYELGEFLDIYKDKAKLSYQQLYVLYNNLRGIKIRATIIGDSSLKFEVVENE